AFGRNPDRQCRSNHIVTFLYVIGSVLVGIPTSSDGTPSKWAIRPSSRSNNVVRPSSFGLICVGVHLIPPDRTAGSPIPDNLAATQSAFYGAACAGACPGGCSSTPEGIPPPPISFDAYWISILAASIR